MSQERCLVLTEIGDATAGHVPLVAQHLPENYFLVIDPNDAIARGQSLSFGQSSGVATVSYGGEPLDRIAAVWDRRPTPVSQIDLDAVEPVFRKYSRQTIGSLGAQILTAFPNALWISSREAVRRAETKSLQLAVASQLGFLVPDTLMTSDPEQASAFVRAREATIVKGLAPFGPMLDAKNCLILLARRITPDTAISYDHLNFSPAIFQQAIDVAEDLRITIVGDDVHAAAIEADTERGNPYNLRDWRLGNFEGNQLIEARILPPDIQERCVRYVKHFGLKFGVIDMVRDKQGKYWFLELNPNGQWGFVEDQTKQPIGRSIARLILSAGQHSTR